MDYVCRDMPRYFPYIGPFSITAQSRIKKLVSSFWSDLELSWCSPRLKLRVGLGSRILSLRVYDLESFISFHVHAGCSACYVGETNRHFATRIREHLSSYKNSHIFKHLRGSENCRSLCSEDCFQILDSASTTFQLKIKQAMHILWDQPSLNSQVKHLNLSLSY